ncbi:glycosyltransferase involved in cell wall biosynthesis [Microbacterium trichothecenolyticum]|uniref:glycosyltransferase family 2 protein n=1 Tax=Microbacterium trichothecenolyticum TaxID=69370 RepID=UPI00285E447F|nr:glycosyltransferase family 2 protein [Microbacterium trichothecenolyticum]MDR7110856.1 glycosyltransferase involved in cell wall biosynthesis [Microbacterium trichothecenolyticum]
MVSVVIAAHNEEAVVGRCIEALLEQGVDAPQIFVSANGCTDATARVALARGATVIDRAEPGKPAALNAADAAADTFPRVYLDADIVLPAGAIDAVDRMFGGADAPLAAAPHRRIDTAGCAMAVKAYYAINERLPVFRDGLFGRGMFVVSAAGRARFSEFPALTADDLFADAQFDGWEKRPLGEVEISVAAPRSTRDLIRRLVRVRRGNTEMRAAAARGEVRSTVRPSDRRAWARVVREDPRLFFAAVPYVVITLTASLLARRTPVAAAAWGRDDSTRTTPSVAQWGST